MFYDITVLDINTVILTVLWHSGEDQFSYSDTTHLDTFNVWLCSQGCKGKQHTNSLHPDIIP